MTETLYRIKKLVWEECERYAPHVYTPFGMYHIYFHKIGNKNWFYSLNCHSYPCESQEEAKAAAESHYRERILMCLEEYATIKDIDGNIHIVFEQPMKIKSGRVDYTLKGISMKNEGVID